MIPGIVSVPANPANFGGKRRAEDIRYIVVHYTGNDGDRARNNARYFQTNIVKASAHYFVDDSTVYQSVDDLRVAWSVGGRKYPSCAETGGGTLYGVATNANTLNVEMCDTQRDGVILATRATIDRTVELIRALMAKYGVPPERVIRHFDVTGKLCPAYLVEREAWEDFRARLQPRPWEQASPAHREAVRWAVERGVLKGNGSGDLKLRELVTREQLCTILYRALK